MAAKKKHKSAKSQTKPHESLSDKLRKRLDEATGAVLRMPKKLK